MCCYVKLVVRPRDCQGPTHLGEIFYERVNIAAQSKRPVGREGHDVRIGSHRPQTGNPRVILVLLELVGDALNSVVILEVSG